MIWEKTLNQNIEIPVFVVNNSSAFIPASDVPHSVPALGKSCVSLVWDAMFQGHLPARYGALDAETRQVEGRLADPQLG